MRDDSSPPGGPPPAGGSPLGGSEDDELLRRAGAGDAAAFSRLVARLAPRAGAVAARIAGNRSDAEEIVQEAFTRLWLKAPDWRSGGAMPSTWLHRVVVNLALDRRRKPVTQPIEAADHVADPAPGGEAVLLADERRRRVAAAVEALPERQRAALALCHFEEMSDVDAAAVLEISVGALESLLVRARRTLREALADLAPAEGKPS